MSATETSACSSSATSRSTAPTTRRSRSCPRATRGSWRTREGAPAAGGARPGGWGLVVRGVVRGGGGAGAAKGGGCRQIEEALRPGREGRWPQRGPRPLGGGGVFFPNLKREGLAVVHLA